MEKAQQRVALWQERLRRWKISGKSGPEWAKEQQIPYPTFCYWRTKLADQTSKSFVELVDASRTHQELYLEWQGITVRLSNDFDERALKRFLQLLQELQC